MTDNSSNDADTGEKHAWVRRLVTECQSPLIRYARSIVRDEHIACDLVQETFLRLCQQSSSELADREAAWLFRVCHNLAVNRYRKERRMTIGNALTESASDKSASNKSIRDNLSRSQADPAKAMAASEDCDQVDRLINELPENQQKVIRLKFYSGLKYRQISQATGLSEGNVGFLLHKALGKLREQMRLSGSSLP